MRFVAQITRIVVSSGHAIASGIIIMQFPVLYTSKCASSPIFLPKVLPELLYVVILVPILIVPELGPQVSCWNPDDFRVRCSRSLKVLAQVMYESLHFLGSIR